VLFHFLTFNLEKQTDALAIVAHQPTELCFHHTTEMQQVENIRYIHIQPIRNNQCGLSLGRLHFLTSLHLRNGFNAQKVSECSVVVKVLNNVEDSLLARGLLLLGGFLLHKLDGIGPVNLSSKSCEPTWFVHDGEEECAVRPDCRLWYEKHP